MRHNSLTYALGKPESRTDKLTGRSRGSLRIAASMLLVAAGIVGVAGAATVTVINTNDTGAGSLRQAIAGASAGDVINFAIPGCVGGVCTITLTSGEIPVAVGLNIQGPGANLLIISGNHASRIFNVTAPAAVSISGVTLRDGAPVGGGFGGGAILVNMGAAAPPFNLTDAVLTNNDVTNAGNPLGGGIDNEGGTVTITRCAIVNNVATFRGGGVQNQGFGSMAIVNSTIAGNTAGPTGIGGGIRTLLPLTLTNCTFYGNSAQTGGNVSRLNGTFDFQNTIIAGGILLGVGGSGPDIDGTVNSLDFNLIQDPSGATITGTTTHNITGISPRLGPLQNNGGPSPTLRPLFGSPVIDAGVANGLTVDQRGFPRPIGVMDIGAVEVQAGELDGYQVSYASNLVAGDSYVDLTNSGATVNAAGTTSQNICVNVYTFDPSEELVSCCACPVTPNGLASLSVKQDLVSNTLTPGVPGSVVIKLVASPVPAGGACNASLPTLTTLASGLLAWDTTLTQNTSVGTFETNRVRFSPASLTAPELDRITRFCGFIQANGSGFGICRSCRIGALGGAQQ